MPPFGFGAPRPLTLSSLPGCEPAGHLQRDRAVRRRHVDGRAERGVGVADRDVDDQIVAAAGVERRGLDVDDDVEVAGGAAVPSRLALAGDADAGAVLDPGPDLDVEVLRGALAAGAAARLTGMLDDGAVAATARARVREREQPLGVGDDTAAAALRADGGRGARLGAGSCAAVTGGLELDRHAHLGAAERVLERERRVRLDVGAALGHGSALARGAAEDPAEEIGEVEVRELRPALCAGTAVRRAERVVGLALLGVGEHVVGALDLLEARLVAAARVGMVLAGELAIGLLDLVGRGVLGNAEGVVRIGHYSATITLAGRSTLSPSR